MSTGKVEFGTTYAALVGRMLANRRERKGWDQETLADRVQLNRSTWSRIENGESALNIDQLALAAEALGCKPWQILQEADNARDSVNAEGIKVEASRKTDPALVLLAGAALATLLSRVLKR